jgi:hypothetical protein
LGTAKEKTMTSERVTMLQRRIQKAGKITGALRMGAAITLPLGPTAAIMFGLCRINVESRLPGSSDVALISETGALLLWLLISPAVLIPVAFVAAWLYRFTQVRRLRRELLALPAADRRAALVLPQRAAHAGDAGKIVLSLRRAVRARSELAPVSPGAGRGDEPAAADEA